MAVVNPPGGALDIAFSFDTTGSMCSILDEVRGRLKDMIQRLQADIPGIRIAVFAHGDYCDKKTSYVTKHVDFSTSVVDLCDFVQNVGSTGGGDTDECYELVLREVREKLSWLPHSNKVLVMLGDAPPHEPSYNLNTDNIDWRLETKYLGNMGVKIYGVQCQSSHSAKKFYETISRNTGGRYVQLKDFANIFDLMMAICYREHGAEFLQAYEKEVRARGDGCSTNKDMLAAFGALGDAIPAPLSPLHGDSVTKTKLKRKATASLKTGETKPKLKKKDPTPSPAIGSTKLKLMKKGCKYAPKSPLKKIRSFEDKAPKPKVVTTKKVQFRTSEKKETPSSKRRPRENVPDRNFVLSGQPWSAWRLAMCSDAPSSASRGWKKRRYGQGFRLRKLFKETASLSLYEIAVQNMSSSKKSVVRAIISKRDCSLSNWESGLLGCFELKSEVNRVMKNGGRIFIRRLPLRNRDHALKTVKSLKKYDYAWSAIRGLRSSHRDMEIDTRS